MILLKPKDVDPINRFISLANGDIDKAVGLAKAKDKLDYQMMLAIKGGFEASWGVVQELEKERPDCPTCAFNRGTHFLNKGRFQEGLVLMEIGRRFNSWGCLHKINNMAQPQWDGEEDLSGKFVLVFMEGGYGDEIIQIRFMKDLAERGAKVTVACRASAANIYSQVEGIHAMITPQSACWHDLWIPSYSLPRLLKKEEADLWQGQYIFADPKYTNKMSRLIKSNKLKVGFRWRGLTAYEQDGFRKIPFEDFLSAVDQEHVDLFSLQLSDCSDIIVEKHPQITDLEWALKSWEDTAGAIANLDLVITSCTSVAHMSAAMGKPTWIIVPILPYYIWAQAGSTSPWYKSVTLHRQVVYNDWQEPFKNIKNDLHAM